MDRTGTLTRIAPHQMWFALALVAACAGCVDLGPSVALDLNFDGGPMCSTGCYDFDFEIFPEQQNFLRGDSLELSSFSTKGWDDASWSSSGSAIALIRPDGSLDSTITTAQRRVWVKALGTGTGTVRARALGGGGQLSDSSTLFVADSSAIAEIRAYGIVAGTPLKVGVAAAVDVVLLDAGVRSFHAMPTEWSVSDTTIARVTPPTFSPDRLSRYSIMPKRAGNATLTFAFLGVRKTVEIVVTN